MALRVESGLRGIREGRHVSLTLLSGGKLEQSRFLARLKVAHEVALVEARVVQLVLQLSPRNAIDRGVLCQSLRRVEVASDFRLWPQRDFRWVPDVLRLRLENRLLAFNRACCSVMRGLLDAGERWHFL